jgi:D-3-phosphoglycerate dehydrogenase
MAFLLYDDIPGVIGRVGTLFGDAGVNIANMTVSRNRAGGKALMVLTIDSRAPEDLLTQLHEGMDASYVISG